MSLWRLSIYLIDRGWVEREGSLSENVQGVQQSLGANAKLSKTDAWAFPPNEWRLRQFVSFKKGKVTGIIHILRANLKQVPPKTCCEV